MKRQAQRAADDPDVRLHMLNMAYDAGYHCGYQHLQPDYEVLTGAPREQFYQGLIDGRRMRAAMEQSMERAVGDVRQIVADGVTELLTNMKGNDNG